MNNNTNNIFPANHNFYNVNGYVLSMTEDQADELHAAGVNITPVDDDNGHDDDFDTRTAFAVASTGWTLHRRW